MSIALFVIFLFADLMVVLMCKFSYGKRDTYIEGMLMGVHIPQEEVDNEEVQSICLRSRKIWNRFHQVNLALGALVCGLCFFRFEVFLIVWMVWLSVYLILVWFLVTIPHKQMYQLKIKNHWINQNTRNRVCVDTALAALSKKMAFSWKWHLPAAAVILLSGLWFLNGNGQGDLDGTEWILFAASMGVTMVFGGFHLWVIKRQNIVYSGNTEVNFAVNRAVKRAWSGGLIAAGYINVVSWIFLEVRLLSRQWLSGMDYAVYGGIQLLAAMAFLLPVLCIHRTKQKILAQDAQPITIDDDEFWKNGWYNNPYDTRLMVPDRMCGMNYSFNMAKPASWLIYGGTVVLLAGTILWVAVVMIQLSTAETSFSLENGRACFKAAGYEYEFTPDEVEGLELLSKLPEENFMKTNGGATADYDFGHFRGSKTGKCMMFLRTGYEPILKVTLPDMVIFANSREEGTAEQWYRLIQEEAAGNFATAG